MYLTRAKQAWLRMGLYHRKNGIFNDAIKRYVSVNGPALFSGSSSGGNTCSYLVFFVCPHSFQNALAADPSDK